MQRGSVKYTNGQSIFSKRFKAKDAEDARQKARKIIKRAGCGLVPGSIRLGATKLPDIDLVFEAPLSLKQRAIGGEQNMLKALYESCFQDAL